MSSDCGVRINGEDEQDSLVAGKQRKVWKSKSPPKKVLEILRKWFTVFYSVGKKLTIFVAKVMNQILLGENRPILI